MGYTTGWWCHCPAVGWADLSWWGCGLIAAEQEQLAPNAATFLMLCCYILNFKQDQITGCPKRGLQTSCVCYESHVTVMAGFGKRMRRSRHPPMVDTSSKWGLRFNYRVRTSKSFQIYQFGSSFWPVLTACPFIRQYLWERPPRTAAPRRRPDLSTESTSAAHFALARRKLSRTFSPRKLTSELYFFVQSMTCEGCLLFLIWFHVCY